MQTDCLYQKNMRVCKCSCNWMHICSYLIERCVTYHRSSSKPSWVNLRRCRRSKPPGNGEVFGFILAITKKLITILVITIYNDRHFFAMIGKRLGTGYKYFLVLRGSNTLFTNSSLLDKHRRLFAKLLAVQIEVLPLTQVRILLFTPFSASNLL